MNHPNPHRPSLRKPLQSTLALAIGLACLGGAWAQQQEGSDTPEGRDPYYIGAGIGFNYDSNVLRTANNEQSDTSTSLRLLGGLNKNLGRQRLYLDGNVSDNRYNDFKSLNNTSYGLNTGIDWSTIGNVTGNLRYGTTQSLANRALPGVAPSSSRNTERTQLAGASIRYPMNSRLAVEGGLQHRAVDYSQPAYNVLENTQNVANAGVVYGLSGVLTLGVGARVTKSEAPHYSPAGGDKTDRNDVDFTVNWSPTGLSTLTGRLSVGKEDHSRATAANFSGVTGMVGWDYRATGRLRFNTSLARDTGSEARFVGFQGGSDSAATESYRLTTTFQANALYQLSGKIEANALYSRTRGALVSQNVSSGNDTLDTLGVGATYKATRNVTLSCKLGHENRSTTSALSSSYDANTFGCLANFVLR